MKDVARRHPAFCYFALTFALSWGLVILVVGPGGFPGTPDETAALLPVVVVTLLVGPPVSGLVLTALVHRTAGFRDMWFRLLTWRVGARWYAIALLTTPVLAGAALLALLPRSAEYLPGIVVTDDRVSLLITGVAVGLAAGVFEEIGWTGFALPMLRRKFGVVASGLVLGALWGAWHYITAIWGSGTASRDFSVTLFLPQIFFYVGVLPAYRILMVWVYDRTQSLLLAMLMHASLTGNVLFILAPPAIAGLMALAWYVVFAAALWMAIAVILRRDRGTALA